MRPIRLLIDRLLLWVGHLRTSHEVLWRWTPELVVGASESWLRTVKALVVWPWTPERLVSERGVSLIPERLLVSEMVALVTRTPKLVVMGTHHSIVGRHVPWRFVHQIRRNPVHGREITTAVVVKLIEISPVERRGIGPTSLLLW